MRKTIQNKKSGLGGIRTRGQGVPDRGLRPSNPGRPSVAEGQISKELKEMDSAGFEPAARAFRTEGSALDPGATFGRRKVARYLSNKKTIQNKKSGLGGIRTRGLYVANVTIYP